MPGRMTAAVIGFLFFWVIASLSFGAEVGTAAEAEAMVKKAITYMQIHGKEKAFAETTNPKEQFIARDLYVTIYALNG